MSTGYTRRCRVPECCWVGCSGDAAHALSWWVVVMVVVVRTAEGSGACCIRLCFINAWGLR